MKHFEGFDPLSPTLRYSECYGSCMGSEFEHATAWYDEALSVRSGDLVRVGLRRADGGVAYIIKRLEITRDGFWFLIATAESASLVLLNSGNLVSFARIVGLAQRDSDYMQAPDIAGITADARSLEIHELFSRKAREEWATLGYVTGVEFPGMEAVLARGYPAQVPFEEASSTTIPVTNATTPTAPRDISIRAINGTLEFSWDTPVVRPMGTRFQIWSAVNCADATAGTLRWEGDAQRATLQFLQIDVSSGSFFWVRSIANSYASAWSPNTYGTPAAQTPPAESRIVISDPQFRRGPSIGSYWKVQGSTAAASLSPSGGPSDGTGKLVVVGSTGMGQFDFCCNRTGDNDPVAPAQSGQWANWSLMFRRTATVQSGGGFNVHMLNRYSQGGANVDLDLVTFVRCDTPTINVWTTVVGSTQISALAQYNQLFPFLRFDQSNFGAGTIEVSQIDVLLR
ncbi:MAG: hypothetical protein WDO56_03920 [Gammaproteobacteria bacterium]